MTQIVGILYRDKKEDYLSQKANATAADDFNT